MRILVTFALEAEFAPWRKLRSFDRKPLANGRITFFCGAFGEDSVEVLLTGIGGLRCEETLEAYDALLGGKPDCLISSGLAGALKNVLKPGDLFVPETVRTLKNDANTQSDIILREGAVLKGAVPINTLITMTRLVSTAEEKCRLAFFGEAIDMESAVIMAHFADAAVPKVVIRAISDAASEDLPIDFDRCVTPQGAIKPLSLVNAIVRRPGNLPNLVRFGRQSSVAARKLADFLDQFVVAIFAVRKKAPAV
ncbi:MAG: hypothetical protein DMG40_09800 [Acidobacteria bacterium]|nr:MAG: hypothetical protein DMG40_09800 [Acidobacteriota bacterium]